MLKRALVLFLFLVSFVSHGQVINAVSMTTDLPVKTVKAGDEIELVLKASIIKNWYIYTVGFDTECGPLPLVVTLEKHPSFEIVGELKAVNDKLKHDKIFDCDVRVFEGTGEFRQKIRILNAENLEIK